MGNISQKGVSGEISIDSFLKSISRRASEEGDHIESEDELRLAQGKQKIDHEERRLQAELDQKNNELEELKTDRDLKKKVAYFVFALLTIETVALFAILLFQGFKPGAFEIGESTLNIFVPATVLQVSSMAVIITRYLFSKKW